MTKSQAVLLYQLAGKKCGIVVMTTDFIISGYVSPIGDARDQAILTTAPLFLLFLPLGVGFFTRFTCILQ